MYFSKVSLASFSKRTFLLYFVLMLHFLHAFSAIENPSQVSLSSALRAPLDPASVVSVIQGPREFGSCGDALVLDARSSTGALLVSKCEIPSYSF